MSKELYYSQLQQLIPSVSRETMERLDQFIALLERWNSRINLVRYRTLDELWQRHIINSAELIPYIPSNAYTVTDFGSGGGFPGIILGILCPLHVHLIESDSRKCAFLQEAGRFAQITPTIQNQRTEQLIAWESDVLTARAFAPLPKLIQLTENFITKAKICLYLKGQNSVEEIGEAESQFARVQPAQFSSQSNIIIIQGGRSDDQPGSAS